MVPPLSEGAATQAPKGSTEVAANCGGRPDTLRLFPAVVSRLGYSRINDNFMHLPVRRPRLLLWKSAAAAVLDLGRHSIGGARCAGSGYFTVNPTVAGSSPARR